MESLIHKAERKGYRRIILVTDNAKAHRCPEAQRYLGGRKYILKVFYLPSYAPQLNESEGGADRRVRDEVCSNHQHETLEELEKATRACLRTYNKRHKLTNAT